MTTKEIAPIHFFGLRRSGNHAVINWIAAGLADGGRTVEHFNSVAGYPTPEREPAHITDRIRTAGVTVPIFSYEDVRYAGRLSLRHYNAFGGGRGTDIHLLRSFPNAFASRYQRRRNLEAIGRTGRMHELSWQEFTGQWLETAHHINKEADPGGSIGILYDKWFASRRYRDALGIRLGFINHDKGLDAVPPNAMGSSFEGMSKDGQARSMDVLGRFAALAAVDPEAAELYSSILSSEVAEFNERLFGEPAVPGSVHRSA